MVWNCVVGIDWRSFEVQARKGLYCCKEPTGRNMDIKGHSGEISDRNEEYVIGNWRRGDPC